MTAGAAQARPADARTPPAMTVRHALALPVLRRGIPEVLAGRAHLDRRIRWVHAGEVSNMASLLTGGEMLLTTGMGIGARPAEQRAFIEALAARGVAAIVIELGSAFATVPDVLVSAAEDARLPLIALRREIPFVAVTEAIHTEIVSAHYALLRRGQQIQREISSLIIGGEGVPEVLAVLASTLGAPIFLEAPVGRLLSHATPAGYELDPLEVWEAARTSGDAATVCSASVRTGSHEGEGRLLVVDLRSPGDALAATALDHAADIVAIAMLRECQEEELIARERGNFLASLADGRVAPSAIGRAAQAAGLDTVRELLLPIAAELDMPVAAGTDEWSRALREAQRRLVAIGVPAIVGRRPATTIVLALAALRDGEQRAGAADAAAAVLRALARDALGAERLTIAVGRACRTQDCAGELRLTERGAGSAAVLPERPWHDATTLELRRLLWGWREDPDLGAFVTRVLGPLLDRDRRREAVLLATIEVLLAHGGRKAETARALHLNRQALYQRLTRIEELLGIDLGDAEQLLTLHVALLARHYADRA